MLSMSAFPSSNEYPLNRISIHFFYSAVQLLISLIYRIIVSFEHRLYVALFVENLAPNFVISDCSTVSVLLERATAQT